MGDKAGKKDMLRRLQERVDAPNGSEKFSRSLHEPSADLPLFREENVTFSRKQGIILFEVMK